MATHRRNALNGGSAADPLAPPESAAVQEAQAGPLGLDDAFEELHAPPPRRRVWPWLLLLALLGAGGAGGWQLWRSSGQKVTIARATYTVQRADLPIVVNDSGSLEALSSEIVKSRAEGQATIISLVPEGTIITDEDIKNGKVLVELDSSDIRERLTQQEVTFATAEAAYKQAKELFDIDKSSGESKIMQGGLNVKFGKMDLEAYVGRGLAEDALAGRLDLAKLAIALHDEAVSHRKDAEADVADALAGVLEALKEAARPPARPAAGSPETPPEEDRGSPEPKPKAPGAQKPQADAAGGQRSSEAGKAIGGGVLQKKRKLEADIGLAFEEFKRAADKVASYARLRRLGIKSSQQLEAEQLALLRNRITLEQALTARELYLRYDLPKEAEKLLSDYNEAGRELERIKARARATLSAAEAEVKSTEAKYLLQKDKLAKLTSQLEYCVMKATKPGLVVYASSGGDWRHRGNPIDVGSTVIERQEIIKMPDLSTLAVKVKVHESVVDKVRADQPARIRVDAFANRSFTGKVLKVAILPNTSSSWLNPDLKEYDTEISIEGDTAGLKPGMSAEVEIDVKMLRKVIQVPVQAVAASRGKTVVYVVGPDGNEEMREVVIGEANDKLAEIRNGLTEGERVLMEAPQVVSVQDEEAEKDEKKEGEEPNGGPPPEPPAVKPPAGPSEGGGEPPSGRPAGRPGRDRSKPRGSGGGRPPG
ncbi:MAG TPA: efflux RND transporter periplasmic adaptor subunit [Planctomycetota bacterium]|nr:efflux RND transporter periplasmic adaptor subunit [Planctomycetota bacterium]